MIVNLNCPACGSWLDAQNEQGIRVDVCPKCSGIWFDRDEIRQYVEQMSEDPNTKSAELRTKAIKVVRHSQITQEHRVCPHDGSELTTFNYAYNSNVFLDRCERCMGIWVDAEELPKLATYIRGNPVLDRLGEGLATHTEKVSDLCEAKKNYRAGRSNSHLAAAVHMHTVRGLPIPLKDDVPTKRFPVLTLALIVSLFLTFLLMVSDVVPVNHFLLVPSSVAAGDDIYTLFTYIFAHAGFFHVLSNLFFLYLFGDNVEYRIGRTWSFPIFLLCGVAAGIAEVIANPNSTVPIVGASGAISGIVGAYCGFYPFAKLKVLVGYRIMTVPAGIYIGLWFVIQFFYAISTSSLDTGVAFIAHVAGFVMGFLISLVMRFSQRQTDRWEAF